MTSMALLLLLLALAGLAAVGLRVVASDGLGLRPPPAVRPEHETMGSWPR
jgi:hypothetical protein